MPEKKIKNCARGGHKMSAKNMALPPRWTTLPPAIFKNNLEKRQFLQQNKSKSLSREDPNQNLAPADALVPAVYFDLSPANFSDPVQRRGGRPAGA